MSPRLVYCSTTNFLHCGDEYLLLHRNEKKSVDQNRLNGIGGKLEPGEDFLTCAIRETKEETGYVVGPEQVTFCGLAKIEGGYPQDWVFAFFRIEVQEKLFKSGKITDDGELLWMPSDQVLKSQYELVDDLRVLFPEIAHPSSGPFFFHAFINDAEKIEKYTLVKSGVSSW